MFKALIDRFFPTLMGYKRHPGRNPPLEGSGATGKRSHMRRIDQSEFELEHGSGWKDSYAGENGHSCSATAETMPAFCGVGSEERLRGVEGSQVRNGGIWKSTSMVVSRGGV